MLFAMAEVDNIQELGNQVRIEMSDGSSAIAYPTGNGVWVVENIAAPVAPPPPGSVGGGGGGYGKYALVNPLPTSIGPITDYNGTHTLGAKQVQNAAGVIASAAQYPGIDDDLMLGAIVCALVESVMWIYANTTNYPETAGYDYDRDGSDHDSVGLFQQRPSYGWGTPLTSMQIEPSTKSFFGGPNGPRQGASPPGMVDLGPRSAHATLGAWVQDTQGSAHPSRYDESLDAARAILDALIVKVPPGGGGGNGSMTQPFIPDAYDASDPFGSLAGGRSRPHTGSDYNQGIGSGTDAMMIGSGVVEFVGWTDWNGWSISVRLDEAPYYFAYLHGLERPNISEGTRVTKGQTGIFKVGNSGTNSRGAHLHITISDTVQAYNGMGSLVNPWEFIQARL